MGSFDREELQVGESPEEVVRLALMSRYFLAQVQAFLPQGPGILKCANWHVSNLLREAYLFSRSPKRDLFVYLKSFHVAHHSLANLMVGLGLLK